VLLEKGCYLLHKNSIISTVREYRSTAAKEERRWWKGYHESVMEVKDRPASVGRGFLVRGTKFLW
jgi:hypothetical protein